MTKSRGTFHRVAHNFFSLFTPKPRHFSSGCTLIFLLIRFFGAVQRSGVWWGMEVTFLVGYRGQVCGGVQTSLCEQTSSESVGCTPILVSENIRCTPILASQNIRCNPIVASQNISCTPIVAEEHVRCTPIIGAYWSLRNYY